MKIDLDKNDLIRLIKGVDPTYDQMELKVCKYHGTYEGSYGRWSWNYMAFDKYTEEELLEFYKQLKATD